MTALPSGLLLFDTGIYIRFFRGENYPWLGQDLQIFGRTILTAVVASELYAGTRSKQEKQALDDLCRTHAALGHFSSPTAAQWMDTGVAIRRGRTRFGNLEFAHHFRDALIAQEAVHADATLVTENTAHFELWKALLARGRKKLRVFDPA